MLRCLYYTIITLFLADYNRPGMGHMNYFIKNTYNSNVRSPSYLDDEYMCLVQHTEMMKNGYDFESSSDD